MKSLELTVINPFGEIYYIDNPHKVYVETCPAAEGEDMYGLYVIGEVSLAGFNDNGASHTKIGPIIKSKFESYVEEKKNKFLDSLAADEDIIDLRDDAKERRVLRSLPTRFRLGMEGQD